LPFLQEITGCGKVNVDDDIQEWMEKGEQQKHQHFRHFQ
jgi:Tfp pilus assembly protein PilP